MIYILLSILFFTGIFLIFKILEKNSLPVINIIVVNYFFAAILGNLQSFRNPINALSADWLNMAIIIGLLFFVFFIVIGKSVELVGMSVTTVASKMSVIIPIIFSIIYYGEELTTFKIIGILLALIGVILTVYKKDGKNSSKETSKLFIPILLFIGMGITDSFFKYSQKEYINNDNIALFNSTLFYISFFSSLIYVIIKKQTFRLIEKKVLLYGLILGITNYLGVFFFIKALGSGAFDASVIFGINNVSIVILSVFLGLILFKEKLTKINTIGVFSAISAIIFLSLS